MFRPKPPKGSKPSEHPICVIVKSSDGQTCRIEWKVAMATPKIKTEVDRFGSNVEVQVNITQSNLKEVASYIKFHVENDDAAGIDNYRAGFVSNLGPNKLVTYNAAAIELEIQSLRDLCSQTLADMMSSQTPKEIRDQFDIEDDQTAEEKTDVRASNHWSFLDFKPGTSGGHYD